MLRRSASLKGRAAVSITPFRFHISCSHFHDEQFKLVCRPYPCRCSERLVSLSSKEGHQRKDRLHGVHHRAVPTWPDILKQNG